MNASALQLASIVCGLVAAFFWLCSARVRVQDLLDSPLSGHDSLTSAMRRQGRLSAIAAVLTALSVAAQALATYVIACQN